MMKRFKSFFIVVIWLSAIHHDTVAQWFNANPGHGGQVQHVICDPNEDGKMYICSDMEGYYVSHDYGESWESYSFQSLYSNVFNIAVAPTNSDVLLMGSTYGAAKSNDGGDTWSFVNELKGKPVSAMAIDPSNVNYMYMAPSWLEDKVNAFSTSGERSIYYSHNSGTTWTKSNYVAGSEARNAYTITIHPTNGEVLLGSESGLFRSTDHGVNWTSITKPTNAKTCLGADITPDGSWIYAAYERNDGNSGLYVRAYDSGDWTELDANGVMQGKSQLHWRPVIDPNSTTTNHYVMLGTLFRGGNGNENALLEGSFTVSGGTTITGTIQEAFKYTGVESIEEIGWNKYQGVSRTYTYYPKSWTNYTYSRGAFIMSQQSAYIGDLTDASSWKCVTSHQEKNLNSVDFYRTNGTASTFNWDMDGYKNYVVQAMADNGIVESYDGGFSWSQPSIVMTGSWNADAAESVVKEGENTIMLAGTANGFGGALAEWSGRLLYKELADLSGPVDSWQVLIDGKSGSTSGLGSNNRITFIHSDDNIPERVYISTIGGAYVTENIHELVAGNSAFNFVKITSGETEAPGRKIMSDPNDSDIVYLRCTKGTFRGERQSGGNYIWTELSISGNTSGLDSNWGSNGDMTVWANGNTTYLLLTKGDNSSVNYELYLSADGGDNFTQVVTRADAETISNPAWLGAHGFKTGFGGICGLNNQFFFTFQVRENGEKLTKGIAFIKANIGNSLSDIALEDWTGTIGENYMEFPVSRRGKIWEDDEGNAHIYQATMGTGLWKRSLKKKEAPTAVFSADKKEVSIPGTVNFDASASSAYMDRTIVSYSWDFGNETRDTGVTTSHQFTKAGKYTVTLTVEDDEGDTDVSTTTITALDLSLKSIIKAKNTQGFVPLYATLDGSESVSPSSSIESYTWKLKGNVVGTESKLAVQISEQGTYKYELTVKDATGAEHTATHSIDALAFTGESNSYTQVLKEELEGFSIIDPSNNGQQWGGVPSVASLASDNSCQIHYGTIWGDHASSGYDQASGKYSAFLQPNEEVFSLEGINTSGYDHVKLQFGMMKMSIVEGNAVPNGDTGNGVRFEYSADGSQWTEISLVGKFNYANELNSIWYWVELEEELPSVENLRIRYTRLADANGFNSYWRIDDMQFTGPAGVVMGSPEVEIAASKLDPKQLELVELNAQIEGSASFIEWDFGDYADPQIGFGVGPHQVKFSEPGEQEVSVRVLNQMGDTSAKKTLVVSNIVSALSGHVVAAEEQIAMGAEVMISVKLDGEAKAYAWNFGASAEPQSAAGPGPHFVTFSEIGMQDIAVEVTNISGVSSSIQAEGLIEVTAAVIANISNSQSIQVFPNPVIDQMHFEGFKTQINVQLWSLDGQIMMEQIIHPNETLNVDHLRPGLYLLQIREENNQLVIKKINKL